MSRILITGSRTWTDRAVIVQALKEAYESLPGPVILVSGACPSGADAICEDIWKRQGLPIERHPAKWNVHGKRAGFIRNAEMVNTTPDICLAFIKDESRGASMTASLAEQSGIPTRRFTA